MYVEMTYHAREERIDRLVLCVEHLGMGEIVVEARDDRYPGTIRRMTATGIIFVHDERTGRLVTGYMATAAQMHLIYRQARVKYIPEKIYKRVHKNNERFAFLNTF
jgi:hypothetical protein